MVLGCVCLSNPIFKMKIQEKGILAGLHLSPHAKPMGYTFLFFSVVIVLFCFFKDKLQMLHVNFRPK